ncbi:MAG: DUF2855 family protein, partial [Candidatus Binatia bacterium]
FFAPDRARKRAEDWGAVGFQQRTAGAWREFLRASKGWIEVVQGRGPADVERVYRETLAGSARPDQGHVLSLRV